MNARKTDDQPPFKQTIVVLCCILLLNGCCTPRPSTGSFGACFSACKPNLVKSVPIITCQPVDVSTTPGKAASFYVEASGTKLSYQWYFEGGGNPEPIALPSADKPLLEISPVSVANYGLYHCIITSESDENGFVTTRTRDAALGGSPYQGPGGVFMPMQWPSAGGGIASICGQTVSKKWVQFSGTQTPDPGYTGFRGSIWNVTAEPDVQIPNTDYVLQWWVTSANTGCCTNVNGSAYDKGTNVTPGLGYRFIAHFKPYKAPSNGTVIELRGAWTTQ